jgi:hypothetical protein
MPFLIDFAEQKDHNKPYLEDDNKYPTTFRAALYLSIVAGCLIFLCGVFQICAWVKGAL